MQQSLAMLTANTTPEPQPPRSRRKSSTTKPPDLLQKDGKVVSRTSTGKRKFHNKSKNGCDTCKRRRVKCDETRPICNKCSNMGIDCHFSTSPTPAAAASHPTSSSPETTPVTSRKSSTSKRSPKTKTPDQDEILIEQQIQQQLQLPQIKTDTPLEQMVPSESINPIEDLKYPSFASFNPKSPMLDLSTLNSLKTNMLTSQMNSVSSQAIQQLTQQLAGGGGAGGSQSDNVLGNLGLLKNLLGGSLGASLPSILSSIVPTPPESNGPNTAQSVNNNLTINYNSLSTNPTISPQPSMSPPGSPGHVDMNHHHSSQNANIPPPPSAANDQQFNSYGFPQMAPPVASTQPVNSPTLNLVDLRLMYHYTQNVAKTITTAGISEEKIWIEDIPNLAFSHPFLMHSVLAFSATHLSRSQSYLEKYVTYHRGEALRLLREAVLEISPENTDALVASAIILIMDSLANASLPSTLTPTSLPASAWIFHVKGAATILTAVWPLPVTSRFYKFISIDLGDLGDIINNEKNGSIISDLTCFDESIADLYPVGYDSPYLITLAYLDKLHHEKFKSDFILRIFAFPALLDKTFLALLMSGDLTAMRIMRSYYTLLRGFTTEMKDKVWFLEGVSKVLPADVDEYSGGGGMHMMLDFLGGGLPSLSSGVELGYDASLGPEGFMGA
ncbi:hypothetical protein WICPIJ_006830 [Wickerhamomyces pijperi]|uniref:Zn(2)-C6 fungal-type domain-containing protein n=1 Tax=Wickerhamomyces pijperi TaxID=599730 RepID=A0A9P8Q3J3_WICPI|nr:hypothetical protein WICPIJ_006830 [Wickerhamomyces pijperi]